MKTLLLIMILDLLLSILAVSHPAARTVDSVRLSRSAYR